MNILFNFKATSWDIFILFLIDRVSLPNMVPYLRAVISISFMYEIYSVPNETFRIILFEPLFLPEVLTILRRGHFHDAFKIEIEIRKVVITTFVANLGNWFFSI